MARSRRRLLIFCGLAVLVVALGLAGLIWLCIGTGLPSDLKRDLLNADHFELVSLEPFPTGLVNERLDEWQVLGRAEIAGPVKNLVSGTWLGYNP